MSNNNPRPTELDEQELLETARLYRILRLISGKEKEKDEQTLREEWLDLLEEYNPFFSRYEWRGEVKDKISKEEYDSLLAHFPLAS
jgi:hypothetical protein